MVWVKSLLSFLVYCRASRRVYRAKCKSEESSTTIPIVYMLNFWLVPQLFLGLLQLIFSNTSSLERSSPKQLGCDPNCALWPWGQGSVVYPLFPNNSGRNWGKISPLQYKYGTRINFPILISYKSIINDQILKVM